ncbi:hypothetical protein J6590_078411 [Homalodisca vitripennis]|nr:hypothetical protein J6590_078411 [Homalodisca vitripennis]
MRVDPLQLSNIAVYSPRAKKASLTQPRTNGLKVTSEPTPMAGQAVCLQGHYRSAVTHPSSSHARRSVIAYLMITFVSATRHNTT